jgi:hypothetical protein
MTTAVPASSDLAAYMPGIGAAAHTIQRDCQYPGLRR